MDAPTTSPSLPTASHRLRAAATILVHLVVDLFSFLLIPLLVVIEGHFHLTPAQGTGLIAIGSLSSGLIQPVIALLSDKHDTRALGTLGFLVAVLAIGSVGYIHSYAALVALQIVATAGIGAFHPVAAAAVGQLAHQRRSLALAWFYTAGMLGGVGGNLLAPEWAGWFGQLPPLPLPAHGTAAAATTSIATSFDAERGLKSLAYLIPFGLVFVALLVWAIHSIPHRHAGARERHAALDPLVRAARWRMVWLLYIGNILKFSVDNAVIAMVKEWSKHLAASRYVAEGSAAAQSELALHAAHIAGPLQAAKQVGMGIGGLSLGFLLARKYEKHALIAFPLFGALALFALPRIGEWVTSFIGGLTPAQTVQYADWAGWFMCGLAGIGYGATVPLTLSIAQRLLPHRTSLASALMLGGAWSIGSFGPAAAQWIANRFGLSAAFTATAGAMVLAAIVAVPLSKRVLREA